MGGCVASLHVNFWGNPGVGKSGLAGELYGRLSKAGVSVDLVKEYARELQYREALSRRLEGWFETEQLVISAEQYRREVECEDRVQVIVSESPVLQGVVFAPLHYRSELTSILRQLTAGWDSLDVLLNRNVRSDYNSMGRIQSSEESLALRPEIVSILENERPNYVSLDADVALERVYEMVMGRLAQEGSYKPSF